MQGKEIAVKIVKLGSERHTKSGPILDLVVKQLDNGNEMSVACFLNDDKFTFQTGDEVLMTISSKEYKGKTYYSTGVGNISPFKKTPEVAIGITSNGVPPEVWEAKDRRMVKMNALSHAVEVVKIKYGDMTIKEKELLKISDISSLVTLEADTFMDYVYGEDKPF